MSCGPYTLVGVVCCGAIVHAWYVCADIAVVVVAAVVGGKEETKRV